MDAEGFIHTSKIILYDMFETSIIIAGRRPFMRPEDDPRKAPIYPNDLCERKYFSCFMDELVSKWDISKLREVWNIGC